MFVNVVSLHHTVVNYSFHSSGPSKSSHKLYRKNHSCETTLVRLTEDWKHAIDRKELVTILSTDMSKAFDPLSHNLVIKKLKAYAGLLINHWI